MKTLLIALLAIITFVSFKAALAKYQIGEAGMMAANQESGRAGPIIGRG